MKINELLAKKRTLSFEVFPPKRDGAEVEDLLRTIDTLRELSPDFISVTYGAGGTNSGRAAEISGYIKQAGMEPLAHLTGGPSTPEEIDRVARHLRELGVENVLALRGDRPVDFTRPYCEHFAHATDLATYLAPYGFTLGCACYPEGHSESETLYRDLENMKKKEECGATFFITQIFYDNAYYYRLVQEARRIGITSPIIPGIMPLCNPKNIRRIQSMCGSTVPLDFRNMIEVYAENPAIMEEIGISYAVYQIMDLVAKGAPGIHLYTMNQARTAVTICERLSHLFHDFF